MICGASVDAKGLHGLSCKGGTGRSARHHALNDLLWRALSKADIPAVKEPSDLLRTDGKRPDGVMQLPWRTGKCVTWDVTVIDTLVSSYVPATSQTPDAISDSQHGFRRGRSCLTNLLTFLDKVKSYVDTGDDVDAVFLDFAKAFDKVPYMRLTKIEKSWY